MGYKIHRREWHKEHNCNQKQRITPVGALRPQYKISNPFEPSTSGSMFSVETYYCARNCLKTFKAEQKISFQF